MLEGPTFTVYCQQPGEVWCLPSSSCWFLSPQCLPLVCVYVFLLLPSFSVFCLFVHSDMLPIGRFKRSANVSIFYLCLLQFMLSMLLMTGSQTDPPPAPPASRFERPSSSPSPGAFHTYRHNSARPLSYPPTHSQTHQVPCPSPSPGSSHLAGPKKGRSACFPSVSHEVRPLLLSPIAHPSLSPSPETLGSNRPGRCSTSPILHLAPSPLLVAQPSSSPSPDTLVSNGPSRWSAIQVSHPSPSLSPVSHPSASSSKDSRPDQGRRPSTDTADGENTTPKRCWADSHAALPEVGASVSAALQRMAMAMERRNELLAKYLSNQEN